MTMCLHGCQEHPHLRQPWYSLHPCQTATILNLVLARNNEYSQDQDTQVLLIAKENHERFATQADNLNSKAYLLKYELILCSFCVQVPVIVKASSELSRRCTPRAYVLSSWWWVEAVLVALVPTVCFARGYDPMGIVSFAMHASQIPWRLSTTPFRSNSDLCEIMLMTGLCSISLSDIKALALYL